MTEPRYDIDGRELNERETVFRCLDCGMGLVSVREFHPPYACVKYRMTRDDREVWRALRRQLIGDRATNVTKERGA